MNKSFNTTLAADVGNATLAAAGATAAPVFDVLERLFFSKETFAM